MDTWDQSKLEEVITEKHGEKVAKQTDIVRTMTNFQPTRLLYLTCSTLIIH